MQAEMYKIGSIGKGFVAIMARPSLEADAPASIVNIARLGIQQVVSLLEPSEARNLGLHSEREQVKAHSMGFTSFPIPDMGLPPSVEEYAQLAKMLFNQVSAGVNTLIHCHAGIGRSVYWFREYCCTVIWTRNRLLPMPPGCVVFGFLKPPHRSSG